MPELTEGFKIDDAILRKSALVLRAINHKLRQQMLQLIHKREQVTVTELYVKMRLEQSVASQHLAILRGARIVKTQRNGKQILYSVDYERLQEVQALASGLAVKS
jgi:DNA-binding transcriptional ArsR family regulator